MKKLALVLILLVILGSAALADGRYPTPQPTIPMELIPSQDEVKVYTRPNTKANLAGYIIVGGHQEVEVISRQDGWYYVRFTSIYGDTYGYIPASCFQAAATPMPTPTPTPAVNVTAFVCNPVAGDRLNLRLNPSGTAATLGKYYTGAPVVLTGKTQAGFSEVIIGTLTGWMDSDYLTTNPYGFVNAMPEVQVANASGLNLRSGPSTGYKRIGWYPDGATLTVMGIREDGWYHVAVGGQIGFMDSSYMSQTFPWRYGSDSDDSSVSSGVGGSADVCYVHSSSLTDRVNLRTAPSTTAGSIGRFYTGTPVTVLSYTRTGWAYVRIADMTGYMDQSFLTGSVPLQYGQVRYIRNYTGTGLNLRTLPSTDSEVILLCPNGQSVTVLGDLTGGWCYVRVGDLFGYMLSASLKTY